MTSLNEDPKDHNRWIEPIEAAFRGVQPTGLKIACPACGKQGLLITRWVKGPKTKPLYVMHKQRNVLTRVCELSDEQASVAREAVTIRDSDVRRFLMSRRAFVLYSGGKDSLATIYYLKSLLDKTDSSLTAIYVDTTAGLPENTGYVKEVSRWLQVRLEVVKPQSDYFTLAKEWGIPSHGYRWCCRELKIKPIQEFLNNVDGPAVIFDGIRAVESYLRSKYLPIWYHPGFKCISVSPIFNWTNEQVQSVISSDGLPKNLLPKMKSSLECWCGAYKSEADFIDLYQLNPEFFSKLADVEKSNDYRYTYIYKNGKQKSLDELRRELKKSENSE